MDRLFEKVSDLIGEDARLEVYSPLNQHLVNTPGIVLWDKNTASISDDIYQKLRDTISIRPCTFYTMSKVLPYHDFCLALLCCVGFSLNHNVLPGVQAKTFQSAWRRMSIATAIGQKDLQNWIKQHIQDRDAIKYSIVLGVGNIEGSGTVNKALSRESLDRLSTDENIIMQACSSKNIREIKSNGLSTASCFATKVSRTPECQLDDLRIIHSELLGGHL